MDTTTPAAPTKTTSAAPKRTTYKGAEIMVEYIDEEGLPVQSSLYEDVGTLRNAINRCEADEAAFVKSQEMLGTKAKPTVDMASEVSKYNDLNEFGASMEGEDPTPNGEEPKKNRGGRPAKQTVSAGI